MYVLNSEINKFSCNSHTSLPIILLILKLQRLRSGLLVVGCLFSVLGCGFWVVSWSLCSCFLLIYFFVYTEPVEVWIRYLFFLPFETSRLFVTWLRGDFLSKSFLAACLRERFKRIGKLPAQLRDAFVISRKLVAELRDAFVTSRKLPAGLRERFKHVGKLAALLREASK
jgi:hypothetical protein